MSGLMQRAITAVFFVIVMVGCLFTGPYVFTIVFGIITALCLWEYLSMSLESENGSGNLSRKIIGLLLGLLPYGIIGSSKLGLIDGSGELLLGLAIWSVPLVFLLFIYELFSAAKNPFSNVAHILLGVIYIGLPFAILILVAYRTGAFDTSVILGMLLLTWANDTGAYLVGSQIGKTPLLPRISPKKTWEGSLGGVALGLFVAYLLSLFFTDLSLMQWMVLAVIVIIFGAIGDLIESMLKRSKGVKDSGTLLPGHGGFLDRFDAFYFMLPFAAAYLL
ncbi:MAG: phosphatidate cytidylyltransferase [Saprospiraceae bacterium]